MSERLDAYRIKLYQDEVARCMRRLFDEGHMMADGLAEVSVIDRESGIVVTSIKPGFIGVREVDDYHGTDMAVVDLDGNLVYDITPPNDNVDLAIAIFKARPEISAVIHSYPIYCGMFANNSRPIPSPSSSRATSPTSTTRRASPPTSSPLRIAMTRPTSTRSSRSSTAPSSSS